MHAIHLCRTQMHIISHKKSYLHKNQRNTLDKKNADTLPYINEKVFLRAADLKDISHSLSQYCYRKLLFTGSSVKTAVFPCMSLQLSIMWPKYLFVHLSFKKRMLSIFLASAALRSDLSIYKENPRILSGRIMSVMASRESIHLEIGSESCSKLCKKWQKSAMKEN
jgi:hypothetical protein